MTGAWRLLASQRVVWVLGVLPSAPWRRMWRAAPLAVTCAASSGLALTSLTLTMGVTLLLPRAPFGASSRLVPTSMLRVIPLRRSLCRAKLRPRLCLAFLLPRHRRLYLDACRVHKTGAWLTANPSSADTHVPSSPLSHCFAAPSACLFGITTLLASCVVKCWTAGATMPSLAVAAAVRFCVTMPSAM